MGCILLFLARPFLYEEESIVYEAFCDDNRQPLTVTKEWKEDFDTIILRSERMIVEIGTEIGQLRCDALGYSENIYYGVNEEILSKGLGYPIREKQKAGKERVLLEIGTTEQSSIWYKIVRGDILTVKLNETQALYRVKDIEILEYQEDIFTADFDMILYMSMPDYEIRNERREQYLIFCMQIE